MELVSCSNTSNLTSRASGHTMAGRVCSLRALPRHAVMRGSTQTLLDRVHPSFSHHTILIRRHARHANRADQFAVLHQHEATFNRHRARQAEDTHAEAATRNEILKHFG